VAGRRDSADSGRSRLAAGESETTQLLRESYRPGKTLGTAFAHFYAHLFAAWGVIVLDASDPELHRIAGQFIGRRLSKSLKSMTRCWLADKLWKPRATTSK